MKALKAEENPDFECVTIIIRECESHTHPIVQQECAVMDGMFKCVSSIFNRH